MALRRKIKIGELLVKNQLITEEQLDKALSLQKQTGAKLGHMLVELGYLSSRQLLEFLGQQLQIPYVDLTEYKVKPETIRLLPETYARRFRAIVLDDRQAQLLVAMADPTDIFAYDELVKILKRPIRQAIVRESDMLRVLDVVYRRTSEIVNLAEELGEELSLGGMNLTDLIPDAGGEEAPVARLLRSMFEDAVQVGASDIHIEPGERVLRLRQRVDGVLQEQVMKERRIAGALVSRLKLMSGLDISEKRMPQDGRFNFKVRNKSIDVRISTMPLQFGEAVVMRLLDQSSGILDLEQIGMPEAILQRFRTTIHRPHGMVLVTGPTGSGKTTTLYAALNEINASENKIITVEDPVEYRLARINQVQTHEKIGLTFSHVLRSSLRHDPDIIMVGEMRDRETCEIGLRAAMTGHLVLSTLHTNDSVSTALRLLDMGAEGYLVATSLRAVLAQRLVRRLCDGCDEESPLDSAKRNWARSILGELDESAVFKKSRGCSRCNQTGYQGRIGVFEYLEIDDPLADALRRNDTAEFSRLARKQKGFRSLLQSAMELAVRGVTSMEEVIRVAGEVEDENLSSGVGMSGGADMQSRDDSAGNPPEQDAT